MTKYWRLCCAKFCLIWPIFLCWLTASAVIKGSLNEVLNKIFAVHLRSSKSWKPLQVLVWFCFVTHQPLWVIHSQIHVRVALDLARVEKGEVIPDKAAPKSYFLFLSRTTIEPSERIRGPNCKGTKNLSKQMGLITRFLDGASQEIK